MADIDVLEINGGGNLTLRDNRIPLNLTNAMLAVGADGNVLTGESYSRAGLYFNLHLYIFGTEITSYSDITDELAAKLIGAPCYINLDRTAQGHGVGFISNIIKTENKWTIVAYDIKGAKSNNAASSFTFGITVEESGIFYTFPINNTIDDTYTSTYTTWSSTKINNVFATKDDLPDTATINDVAIASFTDGAGGLPVKSLVVDITSSQSGSGDPSPSNPRPISGVSSVDTTVCGKNLFNGTNVINAYFSSNGTITVSGATRLAYARCKANTAYTVSKTAGARFGVAYSSELPAVSLQCSGYTVDNTASSITITTGADAKYICAYVYHSSYDSGTAEDMLSSVQIEESNTATPYKAYTGTTATTALGGTYYGCKLNVATGEMTVKRAKLNFSDMDITKSDTGIFNAYVNNFKSLSVGNDVISNMLIFGGTQRTWLDGKTYAIAPWASTSTNRIAIKGDGTEVTVNDLQANLSGAYIVFDLATEITVQLTPAQLNLLQGKNNIFANSGNINTLVYFKDGEAIITINDLIEADIADKADKSDLPTKTSDLNNDSDFQTGTQVATTVSTKENVIPRLTGTLLAGQTSITISDASIVDGSLLEYFVSDPSVMILSANPTVGSVTLTFEAQASDLVVGVVVL